MKKLLLVFAALLVSSAMMAQNRTTLVSESFDGVSMPSGWNIMGMGTSNWSVSGTNNAGIAANEMLMYYGPQFNGTSRLVTPAVDLTGIESVVFTFSHYLDNYSGGHVLGIATTSDNGTTWNNGWQQNYSTDGRYVVTQNITTPDFGKENVRFCVFYTGNSYNFDNWYFDDIEIFTLENLDLQLKSVSVPSIVALTDANEVNFTITNRGVVPITTFEASYQVDDNEPVVETFTGNIASLATTNYHFVSTFNVLPGAHNVTMNILSVNGTNDDVAENNVKDHPFACAFGSTDRIPMIEHFSSSSCPPCVACNNVMNNFSNNNEGRFGYVKYCMNWPGNGDPYYTQEANVRRVYYGVGAVPDVYLEAQEISYGGIQGLFNNAATVPAYANIIGLFTVEGNVVNASFDLMSYVAIESARLYVCIDEKETHNNIGGNGETSFHHVMMKMWPDAQGTTLSLEGGEIRHFEFSQDMSNTFVEEMNDLEIVVFLQNYGTKEIYNSRFLNEGGEYLSPVQDLIVTCEDNRGTGLATATWGAPAGSTPQGYKVILDGEVVEEMTNELTYSFEVADGDFHVIGVEALYEDGSSVRAISGVNYVWNAPETTLQCRLFPNPADGMVRIETNENLQEIRVYNTLGMLVNTIHADGNSQNLNLANFANGVYFIEMNTEDGAKVTRRLVVSH